MRERGGGGRKRRGGASESCVSSEGAADMGKTAVTSDECLVLIICNSSGECNRFYASIYFYFFLDPIVVAANGPSAQCATD